MRLRPPLFLLLLAACPPSQGEEGGRCALAGTAACEASSHRALVCGDALVWTAYSDCKGSGGCQVDADGTLSCDTTLNSVGDRCAPTSEGKARCEPVDRTSVLRCDGGVLQVAQPCPGGCEPADGGLLCR